MTVFGIYLIQLWCLIGILLGLHSISRRAGLMPFFFMAAGLMVLLNFSPFINIRFQIMPGVRLGIAGHIIAPVILISLIIVYITEGDGLAQLELAGLVGVNLLALMMLSFVVLYLSLDVENVIPPASTTPVLDGLFLRRRIASVVAFTGAMIAVAVVFQFTRNMLPRLPGWVAVAAAFTLALWVDSFLFFLVSDLGLSNFFSNLQNDLIGKTIASISAVVPLALYLAWVARQSPDQIGVAGRPTFAILFGVRGRLNAALQSLESDLRVSRRVYEELTQHIGEVFWMADARTQEIIYISPAFERITGYSRERYHYPFHRIQEIIHPDDRLDHPDVLHLIYQAGENEFRLAHARGHTLWIRNRTFSIDDGRGQIYRYAGIMEDITEQRNARQREFELAVAQERVKVLHDFIRDASHDLKSPLTSILLKLENMERQTDPERRQQMSADLKKLVLHLSTLIDDLFTLSRIEGHDEIVKTPINFDELVASVVRDFDSQAHDKGLTISYEHHAPGCRVMADTEQLKRVVGNLVSNAIRYTVEGEITLKTSIVDDMLQLEVRDTGIGIPEADLPRIFDRFYRSANAKTVSTSGTGLGLAIVWAIIDNHGGQIRAESTVNQGSTLTVLLPCDGEFIAT